MTVSIGMCAFNEEARIGASMQSLFSQAIPPEFELEEILVVASGCTDGTERIVQEWQTRESRLVLLREPVRLGKVSGLNRILERARGEIVVLLNADAILQEAALARLLSSFAADRSVQLACGAAVPDSSRERIPQIVAWLQWDLHNRTLEALSSRELPNHCCDEFMGMRRGFVEVLPSDLVTDGAYLGALASQRGCTVRFCPTARVSVEIPRTLAGILRWRRRIRRGLDQVEDVLGRRANTFSTLLLQNPPLAVQILSRQILRRPSFVFAFLFIVLPLEAAATLLAVVDYAQGRRFEPAWAPVD